jgi:hypothetical protein
MMRAKRVTWLGVAGALWVAFVPATMSASAASGETLEYKNWVLSGTLTDRALGQSIALPEGSSFNGGGELNPGTGAGSLAGTLSTPRFNAPLKLFGTLPVMLGLELSQVGNAEGTLARSETISGDEALVMPVGLEWRVTSVSLMGLTIPTDCVSVAPASLQLTTSVTHEELVSGPWSFTGDATLPRFKCRGGFLGAAFGPILTALMSGAENAYSITIRPPKVTTTTTTTATTPSTSSTITTSTSTTSPTTSTTTTTVTGSQVVYVANADAGPVDAYNTSSAGSVSPVRQADNPNAPNSVWDPWGVAIDRAGSLYVQSFLSDATTFVFAPNPTAGVAPSRIFRAYGPDSRAIAVDNEGYAYVASGESGSLIAVVAPGAAGQPETLYSVEPIRTFTSGEGTFNPWPDILAIDGRDLLVATANGAGNAVEAYEGGASGSSAPLRVLTGAATGLGSCGATCDHLAIAYSPASADVYAAVSGGSEETHISVFPGSAGGDSAPVRTIEGAATGLDGKVITGLAVSQVTGEIYAMVKSAEFESPGQIEVFGATASGNIAPVRAFTDVSTAFADAMGIALGPG